MEQPPPPLPLNQEPAPQSSLFDRLINIFAAPGDVFDEIKRSEVRLRNWLVPVALVTVLMVASFAVVFSQPTVQQQIVEMQQRVFDQQVAAGKMKAEDAEKIKSAIEKMPPWVMQVGGIVQGVVAGFVVVLFWALVVWLLGKVGLKADFSFTKALESSGLAMMIYALGVVVTTLLVVLMGNINARPALSVMVDDFNPLNKTHLLLGAVNLFYLWFTGVLAVALSKLSGVSFGKAGLWMFGFWVISRLLMVAGGLGGFVL